MKRYLAATLIAVIFHILLFCSNIEFTAPNEHSALEISRAECFDIVENGEKTNITAKTPKTLTEKNLPSDDIATAIESQTVENKNSELSPKSLPTAQVSNQNQKSENEDNEDKKRSTAVINKTALSEAVDIPPRRRYAPMPTYPLNARRKGLEGTTTFDIEVSADGRVQQVRLISSSGSEILDEAALKAIKQWRYYPALLDNRPVSCKIKVPIAFRLEQS